MDVIDGNWIKSRLSGQRGEQAELARFIGISPDKLTRVLNGQRKVQPTEVPRVLRFFNERLSHDGAPETDLAQQIGRLNRVGQRVLQKQLDALLETPEFVQQDGSTEKGD